MDKFYVLLISICISSSAFAQNLVSVTPNNATQGQILSLEFSGTNTLFTQGTSTAVWLSQGTPTTINPDNCTVVNDSTVACNFTFTGNHTIGLYSANINGVNNLTLSNSFTLLPFSNQPSIAGIFPDSALLGDTLPLMLSGVNTMFGQVMVTPFVPASFKMLIFSSLVNFLLFIVIKITVFFV